MRSNISKLLIVLLFSVHASFAQKTKQEPVKHEKEVRNMVAFLEYMLNTLASAETPVSDKDIVITSSYNKIFRDTKVQVEDDLDDNRKVITNKDVQAYLKDVDFFLKDARFELNIESIQSLGTEHDKLFYKVTLKRNLKGVTVEGKTINKTIPRFIEINYNPRDQDLKIVSMYTNVFNEKEALKHWWNSLSYQWQFLFREKKNISADSVSVDQIRIITSIDTLDLSHNSFVQTLEPVSQLLDLKVLRLASTAVNDLSPVRNLTGLVELDVRQTPIDDLSPLRYSSNLSTLLLNHTRVNDISVVEKLVNLKHLELANTEVTDFSPFRFLTGLEKLNVSHTAFASLDPITVALGLKELNAAHTHLEDLQPLAALKQVTYLNIDSTRIHDARTMAHLKNLNVLYANNTLLADLAPLQDLKQLERVYCDNTRISETNATSFMAKRPDVLVIYDTEELKGWWNNLEPVWQELLARTARMGEHPSKEELAHVPVLDSLVLTGYRNITSLKPLQRMQKLRVLLVNRTAIDDLSPLRNHRDLQYLDISDTQVSDLGPLSQFKNLSVLRADNTPIQSIDTLIRIKRLQRLFVDETAIDDAQVQNFLAQNPSCLVVYKTDVLSSWWSELSDAWKHVLTDQLPGKTITRIELHTLVELEKLSVQNIPLNDLSPLAPFIRLKDLRASGAAIHDLAPLSTLQRLTSLQLPNNPIRNIAPLVSLRNLTLLDISNSAVSDLRALSTLKKITMLNCSGTPVKKLDPVKGLSNLEALDCSNTDVKSLSPVMNLPLKTLKCYNTRIPSKQVERFKKKNPDCEVIYY